MINDILKISNKYNLDITEDYIKNIMKYNDNIKYCIMFDTQNSHNMLIQKIKSDNTIILYFDIPYKQKDLVNLFNIDVIKLLKDKIYVYYSYNITISINSIIRDDEKYYISCDNESPDKSIELYNYIVEYINNY
ncbi:unknown similar to AMEV116 [Choristoneura rosaceana entomopoxvirus 'L']|uniref:Uncharacterized protein n=1 Tax=Choristoneura rosaceana entomopoxvirus 'L' TaxID=1293539 RepID=A0ABM9QKH0_9POXV|nr:unknown similar to AMEV116 [Choristoneura rosaceana entomopoxvirus 'L']CCU56033.1 unknown similar to AMEV116 [Choristoneura rosaceana entomopoxvirus 'L']